MKSVLFCAILSVMLFSFQCEKDNQDSDIPKCLEDIITQLEKEDCPSVGTVVQYTFQGKTVFVINPKTCGADLTSAVIDEECNTICQLGGIIGNITCEGVNFMDHATDEKQVYP